MPDSRSRTSPSSLVGLIAILVMAVFVGYRMFAVAIPEWESATDLMHLSSRTVAHITHIDSDQGPAGRTVTYGYSVNGRTYSGKGDHVNNLDSVDVRYLPSDPSYSAVDPETNAQAARFRVFWLLMGLTALGAVAFVLGRGMTPRRN
ncbi:MAG: DUF3592 domain-containing protein [Fimbriimonas sp.]|nr:DUF3592 domain-containing protein [Fimbriimonas sp.]